MRFVQQSSNLTLKTLFQVEILTWLETKMHLTDKRIPLKVEPSTSSWKSTKTLNNHPTIDQDKLLIQKQCEVKKTPFWWANIVARKNSVRTDRIQIRNKGLKRLSIKIWIWKKTTTPTLWTAKTKANKPWTKFKVQIISIKKSHQLAKKRTIRI